MSTIEDLGKEPVGGTYERHPKTEEKIIAYLEQSRGAEKSSGSEPNGSSGARNRVSHRHIQSVPMPGRDSKGQSKYVPGGTIDDEPVDYTDAEQAETNRRGAEMVRESIAEQQRLADEAAAGHAAPGLVVENDDTHPGLDHGRPY